jgi:hypothetical protein
MATKCVALIPKPVDMADTVSQTLRICPEDFRAWRSKLIAVNDDSKHTNAAKPTSRKSCSVAMQL